jgi:LuxR family maltose regulon positive regulatory protein
LARGAYDEAARAIELGEEIERKSPIHRWFSSNREMAATRVWVAQGKLSRAEKWANEVESRKFAGVCIEERMRTEAARVHFRLGNWERALALLKTIVEPAREGGRFGHLLPMLALKAAVLDSTREMVAALEALTEALEVAAPEGYVRVFVDLGDPMHSLIARGLRQEQWEPAIASHARMLLEGFEKSESTMSDDGVAHCRYANRSLQVPLSKRELDVLPLLAEGLSNKDIARRLFVSVNTVKTHVQKICSKLGATGRTQAAARARKLGLLP